MNMYIMKKAYAQDSSMEELLREEKWIL